MRAVNAVGLVALLCSGLLALGCGAKRPSTAATPLSPTAATEPTRGTDATNALAQREAAVKEREEKVKQREIELAEAERQMVRKGEEFLKEIREGEELLKQLRKAAGAKPSTPEKGNDNIATFKSGDRVKIRGADGDRYSFNWKEKSSALVAMNFLYWRELAKSVKADDRDGLSKSIVEKEILPIVLEYAIVLELSGRDSLGMPFYEVRVRTGERDVKGKTVYVSQSSLETY